eukprot:SAG11_NODE_2394_length_3407_cov_1.720677_5_plen_94_part_00
MDAALVKLLEVVHLGLGVAEVRGGDALVPERDKTQRALSVARPVVRLAHRAYVVTALVAARAVHVIHASVQVFAVAAADCGVLVQEHGLPTWA